MKKLGLLLVALIVVATTVFAQPGQTGSTYLKYTKHWFAAKGTDAGPTWNVNPVTGGTQEACQPCHAPHNKIGGTPDVLWNHKMGATGLTSWGDAVNDASYRCLSCHDGTVALDAFGGSAGTTGNEMVNPTSGSYKPMVGTNLDDDHPISVAYTTTSTTSTRMWPMYLASATATSASIGWAVSTSSTSGDLRLTYAAPTGTATAGTFTVECGTCHAVHGKGATPGTPYSSLLRIPNTNSQLCLDCHKK